MFRKQCVRTRDAQAFSLSRKLMTDWWAHVKLVHGYRHAIAWCHPTLELQLCAPFRFPIERHCVLVDWHALPAFSSLRQQTLSCRNSPPTHQWPHPINHKTGKRSPISFRGRGGVAGFNACHFSLSSARPLAVPPISSPSPPPKVGQLTAQRMLLLHLFALTFTIHRNELLVLSRNTCRWP